MVLNKDGTKKEVTKNSECKDRLHLIKFPNLPPEPTRNNDPTPLGRPNDPSSPALGGSFARTFHGCAHGVQRHQK